MPVYLKITIGAFLVVAALITIGVVMTVKGRRVARFYRNFTQRAQTATAQVVELEAVGTSRQLPDPDRPFTFFPVVEFTTAAGQHVRARTISGRTPAPARVGDQVRVAYDPGNPQRVDLLRGSGSGMMPPVYQAVGCGMWVVAALLLGFWFLLVIVLNFRA